MISRSTCSGFSPAGRKDLLAGGGLRAAVGLALAICNGENERSAGAGAGNFLLCTWATCSYPVRPGLWCWLFWAIHLPRKLQGPAETPLDIVHLSQADNGHAKANQQTQKVPSPPPQGAMPHHSAFGNSPGMRRLYHGPIISHLLSGNKQSMGHMDLSSREESLAEK